MEEIMSFHGINVADPTMKLTKTVMERDMNLATLQVGGGELIGTVVAK